MQYERSSPGIAARRPRGSTRRWRAAAAGAVAALVVAVALASAGSGGAQPVGAPVARAVESVVLQALVLQDDLGAPAPPGVTDPTWALRSLPLRHAGGALRLAVAPHLWVGPGGTLRLLDPAAARAIVTSQTADIGAVAAGSMRSELARQLASIVRGEQRSASGLSAPGGVQVLRWYSVSVNGGSATADGAVNDWDERDTVVGTPGHLRVSSSVQSGEIEALATLSRSGSRWRVTSLAEKPFQQPT